jgi:hypothetical protein
VAVISYCVNNGVLEFLHLINYEDAMADDRPTKRMTYIPRRRAPREKYSDEDINHALQYLKNPTSVGLCKLEATWHYRNGVSEFLIDMIQTSSKKEIKARKSMADFYKHRASRATMYADDLGFLLAIFHKLNNISNAEVLEDDPFSYEYEFAYRFIDFEQLGEQYKEALGYFNDNIYYPDFTGKTGNHLAAIKSGSFMMGPNTVTDLDIRESADDIQTRTTASLELISLSRTPIDNLSKFLQLLGKISNPVVYTVFSPEEELLAPYADITRAILPHIKMSESILRHFRKMLSDYGSENYTGCVSTAGLVTEEYLIQIYETLSRTPAPQNVMLGELKGLIGEQAKQILAPKNTQKTLDHKTVMKEIKSQDFSKDGATLFAIVSNYILEYCVNTFSQHEVRFNEIMGRDKDFSLFPEIIQISLENIKLYRNVVSHKSTYPIDSLEALKSVYGSLSLLMWWDEQKQTVDGTKSSKEVLEGLIKAAKGYR